MSRQADKELAERFPPVTVEIEYRGRRFSRSLGPEGEYVVGRARACDVTLDDPAVSRRHVSLFAYAGYLRLVAFPDARPVMVNAQEVIERFLADRDIVRLGDTALNIFYTPLDGDGTSDPTGLRVGKTRAQKLEMAASSDVGRALLALHARYGSMLGRLSRTELDSELAQLLGRSPDRARHVLDDLFKALCEDLDPTEVQGAARYVALETALRKNKRSSSRNQSRYDG
jgi:hypothetical protein